MSFALQRAAKGSKAFVKAVQDFATLSAEVLVDISGKPRYLEETLEQMDYMGVRSLPLVVSTAFFVGMILALQVTSELAVFGAKIYLGRVQSPTIVREVGPVITAFIVAGRVGSAIAAELGSMVVTYQIDAMRAMGTDPVRKLVVPRVVAATTMLPALTIVADFVALLSGDLVSVHYAKIRSSFYLTSALANLTVTDVIAGLIRPTVFGYCIAMVGCFEGLRTAGGAKGVRVATTQAVVTCFVLILYFDFLITKFFVTFFPPS